jgi:hypothetical protein
MRPWILVKKMEKARPSRVTSWMLAWGRQVINPLRAVATRNLRLARPVKSCRERSLIGRDCGGGQRSLTVSFWGLVTRLRCDTGWLEIGKALTLCFRAAGLGSHLGKR